MMATCNLCGEQLPEQQLEEWVTHIRLYHPEQYEEPERWPDGSLVVYDKTLEPEEFT